ncbi:Glycine betaine transport system permease protein OpuAB (plasmid) [Paracoccaceae bacterium]|nr:Glycine betaine transport system permease protein OpuAB [Paracoccaceae bacterium]
MAGGPDKVWGRTSRGARGHDAGHGPDGPRSSRPGVLIWDVALVMAALASVLAVKLPGLKTPPAALHLPLDSLIDVVLGYWTEALNTLGLGLLIGLAAFRYDGLSQAVRGLADTLQTMPQFVLLIPFLMFFQVGEFTALLAIIIYAIVPAMRYTEQGLRGVDPNVVEAARQMGCSRWQELVHVRVPLAPPVLALGINQTIMFALAMLAIAALVGTQGLGQEVYVALSKALAGQGLLAGIGIAVIAIVSDRLVRAWIDTLAVRGPRPELSGPV